MKLLEEFYCLKDGYSIPDKYLGAEIKQWRFPQDYQKVVWAMSSCQCIKEAIRTVETYLQPQNKSLPKVRQPCPSDYHPELDFTPYLQDDEISLYQSYISILYWIVELGHLDIYVHTSLLSSYMMHPRIGCMEALYHIFGYLKFMIVLLWYLITNI
jgi:hypothetical protein